MNKPFQNYGERAGIGSVDWGSVINSGISAATQIVNAKQVTAQQQAAANMAMYGAQAQQYASQASIMNTQSIVKALPYVVVGAAVLIGGYIMLKKRR